jgi:hypothetical protein
MNPVLRTHVPITTAQVTRSGRSCATCTAISEPIDSPTSETGGCVAASIKATQSPACSSMDHGGGASLFVRPTPRAS